MLSLNKIRFVLVLAAVFAAWFAVSLSETAHSGAGIVPQSILFVGTYSVRGSRGIYGYSFDHANGSLTALGLRAEAVNPSFITLGPNHNILYATSGVESYKGHPGGTLLAYRIDAKSLALLSQVSSRGADPCYVSLDRSGRFALAANYDSGTVAVFPVLHDGGLGEASAVVQHKGSGLDPDRQAGPHAHFIETTRDNRFAIAADLGLDQLLIYKFDSIHGSLSPAVPAYVKLQKGAGPRHFVFDPAHHFLYVVNEMGSSVSVFAYDSEHGRLQEKQTISALPQGFTGQSDASEIQIDLKGKFLYASTRGPDIITVFRVNHDTGTLELVEAVPTGGKTPRNFTIDPRGEFLLVGNQNSDNIVTFRIDRDTGKLTKVSEIDHVPSPVSLVFAPSS